MTEAQRIAAIAEHCDGCETKPAEFKTRDGRAAFVARTDGLERAGAPLVGWIQEDGGSVVATWYVNGEYFHQIEGPADLIPPIVPVEPSEAVFEAAWNAWDRNYTAGTLKDAIRAAIIQHELEREGE